MREKAANFFRSLQDSICTALEMADSHEKFREDSWTREDSSVAHGGGGRTRVLTNGAIFEQGGVNFSEVLGTLPLAMSEKLTGIPVEQPFYATGVSLVIHPRSPLIPTTHANFRYLEVGDLKWFGGGMDLTPYYLFEEDCVHFHSAIRTACNKHDPTYYPAFKKWCDEYFYLPHRQETRGIGGIFFDYLGKEDPTQLPATFAFINDIGPAFIDAYVPIVNSHKDESYTESQRNFQLLRRGRYVEFNLLYDRGTQFGLHTGGRTESILMSLPPLVRWEYCAQVEPDSREAEILNVLQHPQDWLSTSTG